MNPDQVAMLKVAYVERDKPVNATSKKRAGTKRASFKVSVDAMNGRMAHMLDNKPEDIPEVRTVGEFGPQQNTRVWRRK